MKPHIKIKEFRVKPHRHVALHSWPTKIKPICNSKKKYHSFLEEQIEEVSSLQQLLYASDKYSLLVVFQGMDASGKDGAIRHVMSGINPQGCQVYSFKQPSTEELSHDFLWRTNKCLPERGRIGIFNRSYYEEVLVVRVHPELLQLRGMVDKDSVWPGRYESIAAMEKHLHANGTRIVKIFLHVSPEEQRRRFIERIDNPEKNWKFGSADMSERNYWKEYVKAYEACLQATSADQAPWYIVPADNKEDARLIISQILLETLKDLKMDYPKVTAKRREELKAIRTNL